MFMLKLVVFGATENSKYGVTHESLNGPFVCENALDKKRKVLIQKLAHPQWAQAFREPGKPSNIGGEHGNRGLAGAKGQSSGGRLSYEFFAQLRRKAAAQEPACQLYVFAQLVLHPPVGYRHRRVMRDGSQKL
jgi:hypothetical protein